MASTDREAVLRRRELRDRIRSVRAELAEARRERKRALFEAKERCRAERLAVKEGSRALRIQVLRDLKEVTRTERQTAQRACRERLRGATELPSRASRRHAELVAERRHETELRRIERTERARKKESPPAARLSCAHESDDEVRAHLTSDFLPLFDRVAPSIKGGAGQTRTEVFLKYAESHPDEVLAISGHHAEVRVRELEAEEKALAKGPNRYEAKKAARLERMRARAAHLKEEAGAASTAARERADRIPFGQPILIGHHSEKRHRRDLERIHRGHERAFELSRAAEDLERRADRSEQSGAISSDDPEAITKLREKLAGVERDRERMVDANRAVRSADPRAALLALGFSETLIERALTPDPMGHTGFPPYALKNAAGEAARLRERIRLLEAKAARPTPPAVFGAGVRIEEAENRVRVVFDDKPDEATRTALKRAGFRWSPTVRAWQRHASNAAWYEAKRIAGASEIAAPSVERPTNVIPLHRERTIAPTPVPSERRVKGEELDTVGIAKRIREDIALDGRLPKARYSVRVEKYSMGSTIHVEASGFDFPVFNPDAFHVVGKWVELDRARFSSRFSEEAQYVDRILNQIVDAYHWDKSDPMTDYYNERFHRDVRVVAKKGEWEALEKQKLAEAGLGDQS